MEKAMSGLNLVREILLHPSKNEALLCKLGVFKHDWKWGYRPDESTLLCRNCMRYYASKHLTFYDTECSVYRKRTECPQCGENMVPARNPFQICTSCGMEREGTRKSRLPIENGFTLLELMIMVALLGLIASVAVFGSASMIFETRLSTATRQTSSAIQFARVKAVTENFRFNISCEISESGASAFRISGGEDDNDNGLDPWEDRNNNTIKDAISYPEEQLASGIRYIIAPQTVSIPLPVAGNPNTSTAQITFNPLGRPELSTDAVAIFLTNSQGRLTAVSLDRSGHVKTWRLEGATWLDD
jgi:prepilin-type N-terminal cleavage/methylation domain-containing protein